MVQIAGITAVSRSLSINGGTLRLESLGNQSQLTSLMAAGAWGLTGSQGSGCSTCTVRGNIQQTLDANGNVLTRTDDLGRVTTYIYDSNKNVTSVSQQLDAITDPLSHTTAFQYDGKGGLLK